MPVIVADHVTADSGTGVVHTAYNGQEDFAAGLAYGLEVANPVGANGVYLLTHQCLLVSTYLKQMRASLTY